MAASNGSGAGFWRRNTPQADHHVEERPQPGRLELGLDEGAPLARNHAKRRAGLTELSDKRWDAAKHARVSQGRVHGPIGGNQLLPHVRRDEPHLLRQGQAAALPEVLARRVVESMRAHHMGERGLDQRIAVYQRAIEVEDQPTVMSV